MQAFLFEWIQNNPSKELQARPSNGSLQYIFFFTEKQLIFLLFTNKVALDRYKYRKKILQPYDTKHIPQKWFVHQLWSVHYFLLNTILTRMQSTFEEMLHKLIKKITNNWIQQVHKQSIFTFTRHVNEIDKNLIWPLLLTCNAILPKHIPQNSIAHQ